MKTLRLIILSLGLAALAAQTGCLSTATTATTDTLGPLVAEVAQARIAKEILDRNPKAEAKLGAVADALDAITATAAGADITEAAIRDFVADHAQKWGLTSPEQELLTVGLLATRDRFLQATGQLTAKIGDPKVTVWLNAVKRGIRAGVAAHQAAGPK